MANPMQILHDLEKYLDERITVLLDMDMCVEHRLRLDEIRERAPKT